MLSSRMPLMRISSRITKLIACCWGESFPFYYVTEYPKSGGSWLADMIADYLQIPRPVHYHLPLSFTCVIHNHWGYSPRLRRVFYLYRDGRDVVVSDYFFINRLYDQARDSGIRRYYAKRFKSLFRPGVDRRRCRASLPGFIEDWVKRPGSLLPMWSDHVRQWAFDRPHVYALSYEQLLADCAGTLTRALAHHTDKEVDPEDIAMTVKKHSFLRQTGRKQGVEDRTSFKRKGISGDWRNHFTQEAGELFDRYCGDVLVRLGYAKDRNWHHQLPE